MTNTDRAIVVTERPSALSAWADRGDVRELAERLQMMMPGAQALSEVQALTLAQAAVAHGMDPFNGELWYIPGSGLMAGIKGHRRAAHEQMAREGGGNYWPEFERLDVDECTRLGIPDDALAYRCKIRDTRTINHYTDQIKDLMAAGLPWEAVETIVGFRPYTEGVGYALKTERSKMTLVQRAMKRAEADALKRRFDLPFGAAVGVKGDTDIIVNGEFTEEPQRTPQETLEHGRAILRGDPEPLPFATPEPTGEHAPADVQQEPPQPARQAASPTPPFGRCGNPRSSRSS